ncbi:MAG: CxxxxCH/CxxCH domain-containing protein [Desulfuromonadales bacterium]|nr:CxxxxCH/CxxCH domain-containing protein [Desulfuromonadales bacterium]
MGKIILTVALLVIVIFTGTANATSWSLSSRVMTVGGSLQVRSETPSTAANGTVFKSYTTSSIVPVTLQAATGYQISAVTVNGVSQTLPTANPIAMGLPAFIPVKTSQSVTVAFAKQLVSVTSSITAGGSVSPYGSYIYQVGAAVSFVFTPNQGMSLVSISGLPTGGTLKNASTGATVTLPYQGAVRVAFTVPNTPVTLLGSFLGLVANAGVPQTVLVGSLVTLSGSSVVYDGASSVSYAWTQTGGTPITLSGATTANPAFTATTAGNYQFTLVATDSLGATGSAMVTVTVTSSAAAAAQVQCVNCHITRGIGAAADVFNKWASSRHETGFVMCANCHIGADTGAHPGPLLDSSILQNICNGCHLDGNGNVVGGHPFDKGAYICVNCHDPHSTNGTMTTTPAATHFNNITGVGYPASFVTSRSRCEDCHNANAANPLHRQEWFASGHGAITAAPWRGEDFKTESGCVQCHTTTGFIAYSTGKVTAAWGVSSDKSKEALTCIGCHSDTVAGVVRTVTPSKPFADDVYQNRNISTSNICLNCHSGTNNGNSIQIRVGNSDFGNLPFIAPHYRVAGANLHGKAGYHIPDQTYSFYSSNGHRLIGMGNKANTGNAGPCVACHMTSIVEKHRYKAITTNGTGAITSISSTVCVNCHGSSLGVTQLIDDQAAFANALNVLKAMLAAKGFEYIPNSPRSPNFNNTNWGSGQAGANAMGAAYNYVQLLSDPGAYVHNSAYARKLIVDSIDCLYNGNFTGSIDSALASLVGSGAISQQAADKLAVYKLSTATCTSCHDPSAAGSGSHSQHKADGISCGQCHNTTALSATTQVPGNTTHLNGQVDVVIAPINNKSGGMNFTGNNCSGISCHGNGTQTVSWGNVTTTCESCHVGSSLSVIDGVQAQDRTLSATKGHGKPGILNICLDCHDTNKQHRGGAGMLNDRFIGLLNTKCDYCHDDTSLIPNPTFNNMKSHIDTNGRISDCADCHDPHGTTNLAMIRTTVLGHSITFTTEAELIDQTTNRGFCQVCHTKTKYFRAGVPETIHDSTACFSCHDHKSPNGGFLTKPTKQCDSCHGYPPAPRLTALPVGFGTMNNWSSAIFERYSGGGGAHLVAAHVPKNARPSDSWINCVMCHNPGAHMEDLMLENPPVFISHIRVFVQPQYRFGTGFSGYTGAKRVDPPARNVTGTCFNLSCHMSPSPRWSTER